jgi:hypothetical protein
MLLPVIPGEIGQIEILVAGIVDIAELGKLAQRPRRLVARWRTPAFWRDAGDLGEQLLCALQQVRLGIAGIDALMQIAMRASWRAALPRSRPRGSTMCSSPIPARNPSTLR